MTLVLGGHELEEDRAMEILKEYPESSILLYDLAADPENGCEASDGVTLADLGRMAAINARLDGTDVANLMSPGLAPEWATVPHDARLEDADPEEAGALYDAMAHLYGTFAAIRGIDLAKASKLLHIKRPNAYPVLDSRVVAFYDEAAESTAEQSPRWTGQFQRLYWAAIRRDLIDQGGQLSDVRDHASKTNPLLRALPLLRVLDIIAWRLGQPPNGPL